MTKPEVRIETELGPSLATDDGAGYWQITDSWGDQRFHGTRAQVRAKMRERIRLNAAESDTALARVTAERDAARRMAEIRLHAIESIRHASLRATPTEGE